ncbi:MAG: cyclohydrolase [Myxococcales bacterium]|jgi:GTP cyclohydrolase I|nr:cyclohydrolase [Myxococcales bacterium]
MPIDRTAAANAIDAFLRAIGRDPSVEPDLVGTGGRVADAYVDELCAGYAVDTRALLGASVITSATHASDGLVVVRDVAITTMCPHHLLPATGTATIAMHTRDKLVGVGTLVSLVEAHARRLTLQERIGEAVVADIEAVLEPEWVGCRIVLVHGCMVSRGERAVGSMVETVALRGASGETAMRAHVALGVGR